MRSSRGWCTFVGEGLRKKCLQNCSRENDAECERSGSLRSVDGAPSLYGRSFQVRWIMAGITVIEHLHWRKFHLIGLAALSFSTVLLTPAEPRFLIASISPPSSSLLFWTPHQTKQFLFIITSHLACTAPFRACGLEHALTADWPSSRQILVSLLSTLHLERTQLTPTMLHCTCPLPASLASQACPSLGEKRLKNATTSGYKIHIQPYWP